MIKSPIAYPGAKWKALDLIFSKVPDGITDWREPFFGGGSVTLGFLQHPKSKDCKKFVVGDLATEVFSMWKGIQENPNKVVEIVNEWYSTKLSVQKMITETSGLRGDLKLYIKSVRESKDGKPAEYTGEHEFSYCEEMWDKMCKQGDEFWKWSQEVDCNTLSLYERAARFFLVNKVSFSGMGDSGSLSKDQLIDFSIGYADKILDVAPLLQRIEILNATFQETVKGCDEQNGFIFLDPPYYTQEKSGLYGRGGDTHKGFPHKEFARFFKQDVKAKWLVTYDDSIAVRKMFRGNGIYIEPFNIKYTMAGNTAMDALAGEELFIANYDIAEKGSYDALKSIL